MKIIKFLIRDKINVLFIKSHTIQGVKDCIE